MGKKSNIEEIIEIPLTLVEEWCCEGGLLGNSCLTADLLKKVVEEKKIKCFQKIDPKNGRYILYSEQVLATSSKSFLN